MNDTVKQIVAKLSKVHGKENIQALGGDGVKELERISTGCGQLDKALGGGIPVGRIIEIYGAESSGKSTTCLEIVAQFQKAGKVVGYIDSEFSLDPSYAKALGIDIDNIIISQPDNGEDAFNILIDMARSGVGLIVVDSVAALTPKAEQEGSMEDQQMGVQARMMSKGLRKCTAEVAKNNCTVIFTNQIRCVDINANVYSNNGIIKIKDLKLGDLIHNGKGFVEVKNILKTGFVDGVSIKAKKIREFKISNSHVQPVISNGNYVEKLAKDIAVGDWLISPNIAYDIKYKRVDYSDLYNECIAQANNHCTIPQISDSAKYLTNELAMFLGFYYSDGSMVDCKDKGKKISFTEVNEDRYSLVKNLSIELFGEKSVGGKYPIISIGGEVIYNYLNKIGCNRYECNKIVPKDIINGSNDILISFIRGAFFDTEVHKTFFYFTNNNDAVYTICDLLYSRFGIHSTVSLSRHGSKKLVISGQDYKKYIDEIGFIEYSKEEQSLKYAGCNNSRGKYDNIPREYALKIFNKFVENHIGVVYKTPYMRFLGDSRYNNLDASRLKTIEMLKSINNPIFDDELMFLTNNRFYEIIEINNEQVETADIEVTDGYFIANGILTHNCKIGVLYGNPQTTPGGNALKFASSIRMELRTLTSDEKDADGNKASKRVKAVVVKNKTFPPFRECEFTIRFGEGIDKLESIIIDSFEKGIFTRSGGWTYLFGEYNFANGMAAFREAIEAYNMIDDLKEALDRLNKGKTLEDVKKIVSKHVPEEIFAKKRKVKAVVETETSSDEIAVEEI